MYDVYYVLCCTGVRCAVCGVQCVLCAVCGAQCAVLRVLITSPNACITLLSFSSYSGTVHRAWGGGEVEKVKNIESSDVPLSGIN